MLVCAEHLLAVTLRDQPELHGNLPINQRVRILRVEALFADAAVDIKLHLRAHERAAISG